MATSIIKRNLTFTQITIPSSNYIGLSAGNINVFRSGQLCIARITSSLTITNANTGWTSILTFPTDLAPQYLIAFLLMNDASSTVVQARVSYDTNALQIYSPQAGAKIWGSFVYICQ